MDLTWMPAANAGLNATSAICILIGYTFIRLGNVRAHRAMMGLAFAVSTVFLGSYLYYHAHAGSRRFSGTGGLRAAYLTILASHSLLAVAVVPMILATLWNAYREAWPDHRRWARRTFPVWLYVSVTGVVVYLMLYRM